MERILGSGYQGIIGCDYYSADRKYLNDNEACAQFCLAHLVREIRFFEGHPDLETKKYAKHSLSAMRQLFHIHNSLIEKPDGDRRELGKAGERLWLSIVRLPPEPKAENISKHFLENGDSYLRFIANSGIEPTNNRAEQSIRQVVIDRASSQGTRNANGRAYKQRMWTVLTTCAMRAASAFGFLRQALRAYAENTVAQSFLTL